MSGDALKMIDEALARFAARDLVSGAELRDFLLDLRLELAPLLPEPSLAER